MKYVVETIYWLAIAVLLITGVALAPTWAKFLLGGLTLFLFEIHFLLQKLTQKEEGGERE